MKPWLHAFSARALSRAAEAAGVHLRAAAEA